MRAIKLSGGNVVHCTPFHPPISCPCSTNHIKPPFISTPFLPLSPPFLTITPTHALSSQCRAVSNWVVVIFHLTHITAATTTSTASSSTSTKSPNTIPTLFLFYLFQFLISNFGGSSKHVGRAWIHRACAGKRRKTRFLLVQLSNRGWCECVHHVQITWDVSKYIGKPVQVCLPPHCSIVVLNETKSLTCFSGRLAIEMLKCQGNNMIGPI